MKIINIIELGCSTFASGVDHERGCNQCLGIACVFSCRHGITDALDKLENVARGRCARRRADLLDARRWSEMWTNIQYRILKWISPGTPDCCNGSAYEGKSKLAILLGDEFLGKLSGKTVIDFGCGEGEAIEMAPSMPQGGPNGESNFE